MNAEKIFLFNYRNYCRESVSFCGGVNILCGSNGMGKTNLMEAVCLFSQGRSFRGTESELIRFGSQNAKAELEFFSAGRDQSAEIVFEKGGRRKIRLNKIPLEKTSALLGNFICVLFTPDEMSLIKGTPEVRRRLVDSAIVPLKPSYVRLLSAYNLVLAQKRALLKEKKCPALDIWNEKQAEFGAKIMLARQNYILRLKDAAADTQRDFSGGKEALDISYSPTSPIFPDEKEIREAFFKKLCASEAREKEQRSCLTGPHRDDVVFNINSGAARSFASQGQQRTAVLCVKIAQMEIIREEVGESPVLLLDDVMSELDKNRRAFLAGRIKSCQVILSCTDLSFADFGKDARIIKIKDGRAET